MNLDETSPRIVVLGLARQCVRNVRRNLRAIERWRRSGYQVEAYVGENGSSDGTHELLTNSPLTAVRHVDTSAMAGEALRISRMALGRELVRAAWLERERRSTHVLVADFDHPFLSEVPPAAVLQACASLADPALFAVAASSKPYYDLLALDVGGFQFGELISDIMRDSEASGLALFRRFAAEVFPVQKRVGREVPFLAQSAFNGLCIYRAEDYEQQAYGDVPGQLCEHLGFNWGISARRGGQLLVSSALPLTPPREHRPRTTLHFLGASVLRRMVTRRYS